jgi:hypothetical protein
MWEMVQGLRQEVGNLRSENESLRTTVSALSTPQTNTPEPTTTRKSVMSDPFLFNGSKSLFPQWKGQMEEKLDVDGWRYPREKDKIAYIYGRLEAIPAGQIEPWMKQYRSSPTEYTHKGLFEYLEGIFGDPQKAERASQKLRYMRQNSRPFAEYLVEFNQTLSDAGGFLWDDTIKITMLRPTLHPKLQEVLVTAPSKSTFREYTELAALYWDRLQGIIQRNQRRNQPPLANAPPRAQQQTPASGSAPEPMDWTATGRSQSNPTSGKPRAAWVSATEIEARKAKGLCIRCGQPGHRIPTCPFDTPIRPVQVAQVTSSLQETARPQDTWEEAEGLKEEP